MIDKRWFGQALGTLRANYPGMYVGNETDWGGVVRVYHDRCKHFPKEVVAKTVFGATKSWPDKFPTLGQFQEVLELNHRAYESRAQRQALPPPSKPEQGLEEDNPFMALARRWERESATMGLTPGTPTPERIAKRRMEELNELMSKSWQQSDDTDTPESSDVGSETISEKKRPETRGGSGKRVRSKHKRSA